MFNFLNQAAARKGDKTDHGGEIITATAGYILHGIAVAKAGDMTYCPQCKGEFAIMETLGASTDNGITIAMDGTGTACGAKIISSFTWAQANGVDFAAPDAEPQPVAEHKQLFDHRFKLMDNFSGMPLAHQPYQLEYKGETFRGTTDAMGYTAPLPTESSPGEVICTVLGESSNGN